MICNNRNFPWYNEDMEPRLPEMIRRLFWDMDIERLDIEAHKRTIITRVLNTGTLADWRWLRAAYGLHEVRRVLASTLPFGRDEIRRESRSLASLLLK